MASPGCAHTELSHCLLGSGGNRPSQGSSGSGCSPGPPGCFPPLPVHPRGRNRQCQHLLQDSVTLVPSPAPPPIRKLPAGPSPSRCPDPSGQHLQCFLELTVWQVQPSFRLWRNICYPQDTCNGGEINQGTEDTAREDTSALSPQPGRWPSRHLC